MLLHIVTLSQIRFERVLYKTSSVCDSTFFLQLHLSARNLLAQMGKRARQSAISFQRCTHRSNCLESSPGRKPSGVVTSLRSTVSHFRGDFMKRVVLVAFCFVILSASNLFAQAGNGQVGGIVQDSTKALIPGVTVTLTNKATGVADTRLSNDSGAYNFPSVPPGTYTVTAVLTGFKTSTANDLLVNANDRCAGTLRSMSVGPILRLKSQSLPIRC